MASSGYTPITFVANEQPTTAKWNLIGSNDASFNNGNGLEDGVIVNRHLGAAAVKEANIDRVNMSRIRIGLTSNQTLTSTTIDVNFNNTEFTQGTLLTRSGTRVIVGAGVNKVRISYALMGDSGSGAAYLYAGVMKNTSRVTQQIANVFGGGGFAAVSESTILNVVPGDSLGIVADCGSGTLVLNLGRVPYFSVEVIG